MAFLSAGADPTEKSGRTAVLAKDSAGSMTSTITVTIRSVDFVKQDDLERG